MLECKGFNKPFLGKDESRIPQLQCFLDSPLSGLSHSMNAKGSLKILATNPM